MLLNKNDNRKGIYIEYIKIYGYQEKCIYQRIISKNIRMFYKNKPCVVCGTHNDTIIDHKNGLYNDERVLNIKTQNIDDFQVLCNHCNLQKRQTIIEMKKTGKRYSAINIPIVKTFNISFTKGNETFNANDVEWGIGTFWHDPCDFIVQCIKIINDKK